MKARTGLWSGAFTLLSANSLFFLAGNAMAGFVLGLQVYKTSGSTLLYALFAVMTFLPRVLVPALLGPVLDCCIKIHTLQGIGVLYTTLFLVLAAAAWTGTYSYGLYLLFALILGALESAYNVTYQSVYPEFIARGFFEKAYAVNSTITTVAPVFMLPVAGIIQERIGQRGIVALFLVVTAAAATACVALGQVRTEEKQQVRVISWSDSLRGYFRELWGGAEYLRAEKALLRIVTYNVMLYAAIGALESMLLPFFSTSGERGASRYSLLMASCTMGTLLMSLFFYRVTLPGNKRYVALVGSYALVGVILGGLLFLPFPGMALAYMVFGMACNASNNIRNASVQAYIPGAMRGHFNGAFLMLSMGGKMVGQLVAGMAGEIFPSAAILLIWGAISFGAVFLLLVPGRKDVGRIIRCTG